MSKYEAFYFVGDNQAINRVQVDSSKMRNRGTFSGSLAALVITFLKRSGSYSGYKRYPEFLEMASGGGLYSLRT